MLRECLILGIHFKYHFFTQKTFCHFTSRLNIKTNQEFLCEISIRRFHLDLPGLALFFSFPGDEMNK